ncbi:MAG: DUF5916 domain-containing protein [Gemmatimonadota bacterium]|nr:DUF5916 domain-containing protein [Gemmatimonadota bacterium]
MSAPEATGIVDLPRLTGPVTLDGMPDEAAWDRVEPLPLTMYQPTFRGESDREIELLVAYDDDAIYVAGRLYHDDPSRIGAFSFTRDRYGGDDGIAVAIDTFNDNENALRFTGLPLGARMDHAIEGDGQTPGPGNVSWNTFWDFRTRITDEGWFGEMRIPFSSLRFETEPDGSVVMGLLGFVYESQGDRRWTYPAMDSSAPYARPSAFQDVRLVDVVPRNPVYVSPYALTGAERTQELTAEEDAFTPVDETNFELGGDVKLTPTPNFTIDLTLNTDFAAVEADQQQVNLTRFSLFFEEKRPFFQERAGIFDFSTGTDRGTLFYSRRIGLVDGAPVRILGGARAVGRVGGWDLGLIEMQTAGSGERPGENFGVLRTRRQVLNPNSFVGLMATSRLDDRGRYNVSYGVDGSFRVVGDEYLTVKWLQTFQGGDEVRDAAASGLDAGRVVFDWTRRRLGGLSYQLAATWSGAGYDPAVGFEPRSDFTRGQADLNYVWLPSASSAFRRVWIGSENSVWVRNSDDRIDTGTLQPFVQVEGKSGVTFKASANTRYEDVTSAFPLSDDVLVPSGRYWAIEGIAEMRAARAWPIRPNVTLTAGEFFDGHRIGLTSDVTWPASRHLEVVAGWEWNRIRFDERSQVFDANLVRLTLRGALDTHLSADMFGQYNSVTRRITTNTRVRYNFREGQDLWLVWNEGLNTARDRAGTPRLPLEEARTLTVKYTHTFIF